MELVDIVTNQDVVVGIDTKDNAHAKGLLHRCVIGGVRNAQGDFLLVRQSSTRQDAGQFVFPIGGHVQSKELLENALKREAMEELSLESFSYKYLGKLIYNRFVLQRQENHFFCYFEVYSDKTPVLNHESESFQYFSKKELQTAMKIHPNQFGPSFYATYSVFYT